VRLFRGDKAITLSLDVIKRYWCVVSLVTRDGQVTRATILWLDTCRDSFTTLGKNIINFAKFDLALATPFLQRV